MKQLCVYNSILYFQMSNNFSNGYMEVGGCISAVAAAASAGTRPKNR